MLSSARNNTQTARLIKSLLAPLLHLILNPTFESDHKLAHLLSSFIRATRLDNVSPFWQFQDGFGDNFFDYINKINFNFDVHTLAFE